VSKVFRDFSRSGKGVEVGKRVLRIEGMEGEVSSWFMSVWIGFDEVRVSEGGVVLRSTTSSEWERGGRAMTSWGLWRF
jgi:hypothetical protein